MADARLRVQIEANNKSKAGFRSASASVRAFDKDIKALDKRLDATAKKLGSLGGKSGTISIKIDDVALTRSAVAAGRAYGRAAAAEIQKIVAKINAGGTTLGLSGGRVGAGGVAAAGVGGALIRGAKSSDVKVVTGQTFRENVNSAWRDFSKGMANITRGARRAVSSGRFLRGQAGQNRQAAGGLAGTGFEALFSAEDAAAYTKRLSQVRAARVTRLAAGGIKQSFAGVGQLLAAPITSALRFGGGLIKSSVTELFTGIGNILKNAPSAALRTGRNVLAGGLALGAVAGARASQVENTSASFAEFTQRIGTNAAVLRDLQSASDGTVSKLTLMESAVKAISLGAVSSADDLIQLTDLGAKLGRVFGVGAAKGIEDLTTGLARQSKLILDNLGIIVDVDAAYSSYAESLGKASSALTEQEKKQAFINEGLRQAKSLVAGSTTGVESFAASWEQLKASLSDAWSFMSVSLVPVIKRVADGIRDWAKRISELEPSLENLKIVFEATIEYLVNVLGNNIDRFVELGFKIGDSIAKGIARGIAGVASGEQAAFLAAEGGVGGGIGFQVLKAAVGSSGAGRLEGLGNELKAIAKYQGLVVSELQALQEGAATPNTVRREEELLRSLAELNAKRAALIKKADDILYGSGGGLPFSYTAGRGGGVDAAGIFSRRLQGLNRLSGTPAFRPLPSGVAGPTGPYTGGLTRGVFSGATASATPQLDGAARIMVSAYAARVAAVTASIFGPNVGKGASAAGLPGEVSTLSPLFFGKPSIGAAGPKDTKDPFGLNFALAAFATGIDEVRMALLLGERAVDPYTDELSKITEFYTNQLNDPRQLANTLVESFGGGLETGFRGVFQNIIDGTFQLGDAVKGILTSVLSSLLDATSSAIGTGAKALFSTLLGSANGNVLSGGFQAFANGSPNISRPTLGLVGEGRFNEAVIPLPDGRNVPVEMRGGGGGGDTYNVTIQALDSKSFHSALAENGRAVISVVQQAIGTNTGFRKSVRGS